MQSAAPFALSDGRKKAFAGWAAQMEWAKPDPADVALYRRAVVCQAFPAYRLDELRHTRADEPLRALELLKLARDIQAAG